MLPNLDNVQEQKEFMILPDNKYAVIIKETKIWNNQDGTVALHVKYEVIESEYKGHVFTGFINFINKKGYSPLKGMMKAMHVEYNSSDNEDVLCKKVLAKPMTVKVYTKQNNKGYDNNYVSSWSEYKGDVQKFIDSYTGETMVVKETSSTLEQYKRDHPKETQMNITTDEIPF